MKNIIAITSLLVAGTVFANADATTVHGKTYTNTVELTNGALNSAVNNQGSIAAIVTGKSDNDGVYSGPEFTNNAALLWVKDEGSYKGNQSTTLNALMLGSNVTIYNSDGNPVGEGKFVMNSGREVRLSGDGFLDVNCDTISKINVSSLTEGADIYLNSLGKLTFSGGQWGSNGKDIYADLLAGEAALNAGGNYSVEQSGDYYLITRTLASGVDFTSGVASFNFGDELSLSDSELTLESAVASNLGKYSVSHNNSSITVTYIAAASSIPEPSAFGLLAGLSALALCAVRRRRSRNK